MSKESEKCAICLENLTYNSRNIHETECGHRFHACCFRNITAPICPYCRREIDHEPVRKIQILKNDLYDIIYQEQNNELHQINKYDLHICENRIQHLKRLLYIENKEKHRIKSVIRNTKLYYKCKKQSINNQIKYIRINMKLNADLKKYIREENRKERDKKRKKIHAESDAPTDLPLPHPYDCVRDKPSRTLSDENSPEMQDSQDHEFGFASEYHGIFEANL